MSKPTTTKSIADKPNYKMKTVYKIELDKNKKYVFFVPMSDWSDQEARLLGEEMSNFGFGGIVVRVPHPNKIRVIEQDKTIMEKLISDERG